MKVKKMKLLTLASEMSSVCRRLRFSAAHLGMFTRGEYVDETDELRAIRGKLSIDFCFRLSPEKQLIANVHDWDFETLVREVST